jgi:hypothetical protein
MPLVNYGDEFDSIGNAAAIDINPSDIENAVASSSALSTLGAAFRMDNVVGSTLAKETFGLDRSEVDEDFSPLAEIKGTKYESRADDVAGIFNRKYFDAWKVQVDREEEDRKTVDSAGWWGTGASAVAAILDLPTLIPGGAAVGGLRTGAAIARSAASVAVAGGIGAAVSEAGLQATQQTRTGTESAIAIGSGIVFGGLLGGVAGSLMSRAEQRAATQAIDGVRQAGRGDASMTPVADDVEALYRQGLDSSAGAAQATQDSLDDLSVAGGMMARAVAKSTAKLNPIMRSMTSPSVVQRRLMNGLVENSVYLKKNFEGAGDAAVETLQKQWDRGAYGAALADHLSVWKEARAAGIKMTREDFSRAVGRAARRGDAGENEFVTKAAKAWREKVVEPLKRGGQETGQLPLDLPNRLDETYFHRVYRREKISAQEPEFKAAIRPYIEKSIDDAIKEQAALDAAGKQRPEGQADMSFTSQADRDDYVNGILTDIVHKLTGADQVGIPHGLVSVQQGPLKERTLKVPDRVLEPWLEDDVELVNRRYARKMSADVEIARKYGRADMQDQIAEVVNDYEGLKQGVTDEKAIAALNKRRDADIKDLKAMRDLLRGNYEPQANSTNFARIARAAGTFNYLRTLGGVTLSSLTDAVRPAMVHGLTAYMRDGIGPLIRNLDAVKMSAKDAKLAGAISERILQSRMATLAELTDPYSANSPFERFLDNAANKFTTLTGLNQWTDFQNTIASVMTQNRVLKNAERGVSNLKAREKAYMGYLGLDEDKAARVLKQFQTHGETIDGVRVANTEDWTDDIARRAYFAAINKDVGSTIVQKSVGDVPLFAQSPVGRAVLQFKSFALASNQRVLMRGLQEGPGRAMGGVMGMATVGMFIYWLKNLEAGREVSNNPGTWVAEGLDRSGIFSLGFEVNNAIEKAGGAGVYTGLAALGKMAKPDADMKEPASRFATRGLVEGFLGPTVGLANDVVNTAAIGLRASAGDADMAPADVQTIRRLTPFASLPYWRWLIDGGFNDLGWQQAADFEGVVPELKQAVE